MFQAILLTCIHPIRADQVVSKRPKRRNEETQRPGFNLIALNLISSGTCHAGIWHVLSLKLLVDFALLIDYDCLQVGRHQMDSLDQVDLGYPSDVFSNLKTIIDLAWIVSVTAISFF